VITVTLLVSAEYYIIEGFGRFKMSYVHTHTHTKPPQPHSLQAIFTPSKE
jgi:hypothetical protein